MKIEIITTKKKLTKSLINQMEMGTFFYLDMIDTCTIIGKLLNVRKGAKVAYLIKAGTGYKLIKDNFYRVGTSMISTGPMGSKKSFASDDKCDAYWQKIKDLRRNCGQIYI